MKEQGSEASIQDALEPMMPSVCAAAKSQGKSAEEFIRDAIENEVLRHQLLEGLQSPVLEVITDLQEWERLQMQKLNSGLERRAA